MPYDDDEDHESEENEFIRKIRFDMLKQLPIIDFDEISDEEYKSYLEKKLVIAEKVLEEHKKDIDEREKEISELNQKNAEMGKSLKEAVLSFSKKYSKHVFENCEIHPIEVILIKPKKEVPLSLIEDIVSKCELIFSDGNGFDFLREDGYSFFIDIQSEIPEMLSYERIKSYIMDDIKFDIKDVEERMKNEGTTSKRIDELLEDRVIRNFRNEQQKIMYIERKYNIDSREAKRLLDMVTVIKSSY